MSEQILLILTFCPNTLNPPALLMTAYDNVHELYYVSCGMSCHPYKDVTAIEIK